MKRILMLLALAVFFLSVHPLGADDWVETEYGSFKIERFWVETLGSYTCTYTLVSYKNTTSRTFEDFVTIKAIVYDSSEGMVNFSTRSFFEYEYGPIKPGFEGTVKIPVECDQGVASSVSVSIEKAR